MQSDIKGKVADYIKSNAMIKEGERICVAVSGGADSMCLLFLLKEMASEYEISISAIHVEHGIRGQASLDDMAFVENKCRDLNIPLKTAQVDVPAVFKKAGSTLEETARNERYRIFSAVDADRIALAHHLNDLAETFVFNSIRGTGLKGLKGITPVRGRYIRPLLCVTKQEIEAYCMEKHIEYREDATNNDIYMSRNHIRHVVIPEFLKINSGALRHIYETSGEISEVDDYIEMAVEKAFETCVSTSGTKPLSEFIIDLNTFDSLHKVIASGIIMRVLTKLAGRTKDIGRRHIDAVLTLTRGQSGRHIDLIYGIKAYKNFRYLVIKKPGKYETVEVSKMSLKINYSILSADEMPMERIMEPECYTKYIDYAKIKNVSALMGRYRQPGDHISIKNGSKKLKDLLIDEKIPADRRNDIYLIAMGNEIVWIPEFGRIGERFKITDGTEKILKMELKNG